MPTPEWREEKSEYVIKAICRILASNDLSETIKADLNEALFHALKLLADAVAERMEDKKPKWSPALVNIFFNQPERCSDWIEFMYEPGFSAEDYWNP